MDKNLKIIYILFLIFSGILVAFNTLTTFFGGVGINFVALITIVFTTTMLASKKHCVKKFLDLIIIACLFCLFESVIYFAFELFSFKHVNLRTYQNIVSIVGLLFFIYSSLRFFLDYTNKKILKFNANHKSKHPKEKKAKELINGCLEDKPNNKPVDTIHNNETFIIETEE